MDSAVQLISIRTAYSTHNYCFRPGCLPTATRPTCTDLALHPQKQVQDSSSVWSCITCNTLGDNSTENFRFSSHCDVNHKQNMLQYRLCIDSFACIPCMTAFQGLNKRIGAARSLLTSSAVSGMSPNPPPPLAWPDALGKLRRLAPGQWLHQERVPTVLVVCVATHRRLRYRWHHQR